MISEEFIGEWSQKHVIKYSINYQTDCRMNSGYSSD